MSFRKDFDQEDYLGVWILMAAWSLGCVLTAWQETPLLAAVIAAVVVHSVVAVAYFWRRTGAWMRWRGGDLWWIIEEPFIPGRQTIVSGHYFKWTAVRKLKQLEKKDPMGRSAISDTDLKKRHSKS